MQSVQYWDSLARNPMWCPEFWERFGREASYRGCGVRSHGLGGLVRIPAMSWGTGFKNVPKNCPDIHCTHMSGKDFVNFTIVSASGPQSRPHLEEAHIEEAPVGNRTFTSSLRPHNPAVALASKVQDRQDLQLVKDWLSGKLYSGKGRAAPKLQYERGTDTFSASSLRFRRRISSDPSQFQASPFTTHSSLNTDWPEPLAKKHVRCEKCSEWIASSNRSTVKATHAHLPMHRAPSTKWFISGQSSPRRKESLTMSSLCCSPGNTPRRGAFHFVYALGCTHDTQELAAFCFGDAMDSLEEDAFGHVLELAKLPSKFSFFWKPTPYDFNIERLVHAVGRSVRLILQHKELTLMEGHISERRQTAVEKFLPLRVAHLIEGAALLFTGFSMHSHLHCVSGCAKTECLLKQQSGYLRNLALAAANTEAYLINDAASEEEDDDGEVGDGKDGDGKDANEDMEMNSNAAIATEQQKYLSELDASDYLFGRVKAIARAIVPACKEERCQAPPRRYYWPDDEHLEVNFGDFTSDALTSIHVPELFSYGHRVVYDTAQCLKQLFAGIPSTLSRSILQLSVDSFCEADGSIRLSCYKEKESLIKAMQKKPPKKIISAGQDFLRSFLKAAVYTVGQPPRDWQIRQFRYTATELPRNVILLESGHCAFVQPRPQYSDNILAPHTGREESIWILPPQLTVALLVYLYIYRPLEIWALKACNRPEPVIKTFQNYIFAKNNLGKAVSQPTVWTTDYINSLMKTETKFGFTLGELRLVMKLVMERYHQSLLKHILQPNIVDKNAQHHWRTGLSHYAIDTMRARTGILYGNIEKHILLAESHHAACSLTLPPRNGEPMEEEEWTDFSGDEAHWDIEKMELQKFSC
ncbi:hypothetical protein BDZ89DRAFT_1178148 [Hymenopellis radicata]|nr:hypothetical protein BDZ89DRAFT_1178148 [Hymenopellis radicata]